MKKVLIGIYIVAIALIIFGFTSLIFYSDLDFNISRKVVLILALIYIFHKSKQYKLIVIKQATVLALLYSITISIFF